MAEYAHLSIPDPALASTLEAMAEQPRQTDIATRREEFKTQLIPHLKSQLEPELPPESEYEVKDYMVDVGGAQVLARNIIPRKTTSEETFPVLFWIHGGSKYDMAGRTGYSNGNADLDDYQMRILSVKLRISVVISEYRLAPEHVFPTGLNDLYAVLKYVIKNPSQFSASFKKGLMLAGSSAGGNLCAVLCHRAKDDPFFKDTPITGQALLVACVIHPHAYSKLPEEYRSRLLSMDQNANAPVLGKVEVDAIVGKYRTNLLPSECYKAPPFDPDMSPLLSPSHKGLPPTFIQVCGMDPLRDDGIVYEKVLKENGVKTKLLA
ncbi:hypothetical protein K435DRAFT_646686 [Dendrothele bispora CBS 962.96]|uniref:Alpha/beta hydrolase fold-3 domain-containing protein n=1 Tax=Dendrothele bispora (strain CBS 962.96) TaxID=1314807 RepID=A0A4S8MRX5_DENBC|nr:hypothetical protein K435DRAFT_646686 [Dendrothele bispora CBS 962.96]